jgi:hypothetical protein
MTVVDVHMSAGRRAEENRHPSRRSSTRAARTSIARLRS